MINIENALITTSAFGYLICFILYCFSAIVLQNSLNKTCRKLLWLSVIVETLGIAIRCYNAGYPPLSNMYESMVTFSTLIVYLTLFFTFNNSLPLLEAGASILALILLGISSLFSHEIRPLIPALQSNWLYMHVALSFIGESAFAIAFVLSYLYCLRFLLLDKPSECQSIITKNSYNKTSSLEKFASIVVVYILPVLVFIGFAYLAYNLYINPQPESKLAKVVFFIVVPSGFYIIALLVSTFMYKNSICNLLVNWLPSLEILDAMAYKAIAFGYPVFTIGALIFGMIWANKAWGRYWGWDPKETWALITFLVYSVYLHARLTKGTKGIWNAIISVIGFLVTLFTLFGVNFLLSGLHSYG